MSLVLKVLSLARRLIQEKCTGTVLFMLGCFERGQTGGTQGLFLNSGITPDSTLGPYVVWGIQLWSVVCKANSSHTEMFQYWEKRLR